MRAGLSCRASGLPSSSFLLFSLIRLSTRMESLEQGRIQDLATGGPDFQPRSCEEELFFAVFCDMREPV